MTYETQAGNRYCLGCMRQRDNRETVCPICGYQHGKAPENAMALYPGTFLGNGKYLVGKVLGQGGFGITYVGLDLTLKLRVAIKEYFPMGQVNRDAGTSSLMWSHASDGGSGGRESFLKEAQKMAKVDAISGIVPVREVFYQNNTAYIIMSFIDGITLGAKLRRDGKMTAHECMRILEPAMTALDQAHQKGLIHRDISPDNIMIDRNGKTWILDMGAAKELDNGDRTGTTMSKPVMKLGFTPPEQIIGKNIGPWTDVYAMCATIYYCLTGKLIPQSMDRLMDDKLSFPPEIPPHAVTALRHGLALKPEYRIADMDKLRTELTAALMDSTLSDDQQQQKQKILDGLGTDCHINLNLSFEEAALGCKKEVTFARIEPCKVCGGTGYTGTNHCRSCAATGFALQTAKRIIRIPAGADEQQTIRVSGSGNMGGSGKPDGDLLVKLSVNGHERFVRDGTAVSIEQEISREQAEQGTEIVIPTIDGQVRITIPKGTKSGSVFRIRGKGVPNLQDGGRGDQYVRVVVKETEKQKKQEERNPEQNNELRKDTKKGKKKLGYYLGAGAVFIIIAIMRMLLSGEQTETVSLPTPANARASSSASSSAEIAFYSKAGKLYTIFHDGDQITSVQLQIIHPNGEYDEQSVQSLKSKGESCHAKYPNIYYEVTYNSTTGKTTERYTINKLDTAQSLKDVRESGLLDFDASSYSAAREVLLNKDYYTSSS